MATNILALPPVTLTIVVGNNEDWIDALKYVVDDTTTNPPQLDLTGIEFEMEVRRHATDHEVILSASTRNRKLEVGTPPDVGFLVIKVPVEEMRTKPADDYVADIVATADGFTRTCVVINLTITEGVTKWPSLA
jgi:hypothetical protein